MGLRSFPSIHMVFLTDKLNQSNAGLHFLTMCLIFNFNCRVLRIFGPRREDDGGWRKLHNDELKNLYSSPNIVGLIKSRRMRWAKHVARMDGTRGVHRVLVGKPEGKRPLGRPRRRWEDNLRRDLWEMGVGGDWILLAQDRVRWRALVNSVMNLWVR
ncbi:hypothetical protein L798_12400 [Zootermopsis nevadensis]|uniref:Endonuclease-reverse transcriptase n=1 Tax=Zootermopsis nevadensis TaxID=136037 RepID=A0A067RIA4_ZOONE|nr:hypothetical protein L798_12400 [Zootermopsis nevadensis]